MHNTGPVGCLPYNVVYYKSKQGNLDRYGCVKPQNMVAQEFNRQLKDKVTLLRSQLPLAAFTYVDVYSAKYALIAHAKDQGKHFLPCVKTFLLPKSNNSFGGEL